MQNAYNNLKKTLNIDEIVTGYSGFEAIFDAFGVIVDCIERFEIAMRPTLHISLSIIYRIMQNLDNVFQGKRFGVVKKSVGLFVNLLTRALTLTA